MAQEAFNQAYCTLLQQLDQTVDGSPRVLGSGLGTMFKLKTQAQALMRMPTEDGLETAGPTFEYVAPEQRATRRIR
ncbi:MAG TPA: hypothetical protein VFG30_16370 [Polyangiales bacterium]|nr:hypothetical protein [Polyangiales bacterium]